MKRPFERLSRYQTAACLTLSLCLTAAAFSLQKPASKPSKQITSAKSGPETLSPQAVEFFEKRIRPVLVQNCFTCHSGDNRQGGLLLDSRAALWKGGANGKALIPGQPDKSLLIQSLRYQHPRIKMPPTGKLPANVIADFENWVAMGAPDPRGDSPTKKPANTSWEDAVAVRKNWWSLQPLKQSLAPPIKNQKPKTRNPIDAFLLAKLEAKGLTPAAPANRRTLARRSALLLTGLPPAPQELETFLKDKSPNAYAKWIDGLLASPHFGEQWARHWMDVVRYGETHGYEWNYEIRDPWRYRDYLIRAFNQDVPYDQFVREHIAGDLLAKPRIDAKENRNESIIGTAFYRFGEVGHDNFREIGYDVVDNQIDTLSKAFQATTIACARCHDHKLDAISSRDYYAMFGVLTSARQVIHTIDTPERNQAIKQELRRLKRDFRAEFARLWMQETAETPRYLRAAQQQIAASPEAAASAEGLDAERLKKWVEALNGSAALEEPLHLWNLLAKNASAGEVWQNLSQQFQKESQERRAFNTTHFTPFGNFAAGEMQGWSAEGAGLEDGFAAPGEFAVTLDGEKALHGVYPAGLYTHLLSERLNGSLRSPLFPKEKPLVIVQALGSKGTQFRAIPDFRQLGEAAQNVDRARFGWSRFGQSERNDKNYVDLVTRADNIREAYNTDNPKQNEQRSFFGVTRAYVHSAGENPKDELSHLTQLFRLPAPQSLDEAAQRLTDVLNQALRNWEAEKAADEDVRWIDAMLHRGLFRNEVSASPRVQELVTRYRETEKRLAAPRVVVGMADVGNGFDFPVLVRGDFNSPGETAPRRYLEVFCKRGERFTGEGSGRLELAEKLASPTNPLTARVMVNRIWHHLFGAGLVRTTDDFGHLGEKPSHPELLDYLANQFIQQKWSVKRLIRSLVLTDAFQRSAIPSAKSRQADPQNRLLQRFPARRLTAEPIRDSILAVSGRLDRTLYGPSIDPYRIKPTPERKLFSGPLDGAGRRSVYTKITLMEGPAFLSAFNFPDPKAAQGKRDVTNVPTQALTLLNDPFVVDQADFWAKRLVTEKDDSAEARIGRMFESALGRPPSRTETEQFGKLLGELQTLHGVKPEEMLTNPTLWKDVAHTLFNLKEFIYVP